MNVLVPPILHFPRHITTDSIVYECDSGWMRVEPGSATGTNALGHIQLEQAGMRMSMYHLWGEI